METLFRLLGLRKLSSTIRPYRKSNSHPPRSKRQYYVRPKLEELEGRTLLSASILDPGFETPAIGAGAFKYDPAGSPWTFSGTAGVSGNGSGFTSGNPNAPQGRQVAFVQETGGISQNVSFTAGTYYISFQAAQRANYQTTFQKIEVLVDARLVCAIAPLGSSYAGYATDSFTVAAGMHAVSFVGLNPKGGDNTAFVDKVGINFEANVRDPGFELPNVGAWSSGSFRYDPIGSPWTFSGSAGVSGNGSGFTSGNPNAPEGSQVGFVQETGSISQNVVFGAGTYFLSFQAAQRANNQNGFQAIKVLVDGGAVGTVIPTGPGYMLYRTSPFTVGAGTHTISFVGLDPLGGDNTDFIDKIAVNFMARVDDAGFESPSVGAGSFQYDPTSSPWTFSGLAGISGNGSGFTSGNSNAPEGSQVAFVQETGSISQSAEFAGGTYVVSFQAAQRANYNTGSVHGVQVLIDGNLVGAYFASNLSIFYTSCTTNAFSVAAGMHTLSFVGLNPWGGDNTTFIDDVRIVAPDRFRGLLGDARIESMASSLLNRDYYLSRNDMMQIFREAETEDGATGTITATQINDFRTLVNDAGSVGLTGYVLNLSNKIANGDPANAHYRGAPLGNLSTSTTGSQLEQLVDKWFLGTDHPLTVAGLTYTLRNGPLFGPGGPSYQDVYQGYVGDCWVMASLAEMAYRYAWGIQQTFIDNGDGTYTVEFYNNGTPDYVTVDRYLPADGNGNFYYARPGHNGALWAPLEEKAYVQLCESGWNGRPAVNAYSSIDGGDDGQMLQQITGNKLVGLFGFWLTGFNSADTFLGALGGSELVTLDTNPVESSGNGIVAQHVYTVLGYDASTQTFALLNPWGYDTDYPYNGGNCPGIVHLTWSQIQQDFFDWHEIAI